MKYIRILLILITCALFYYNFKGELIPVNNGIGWDGRQYAYYTAQLDSAIQNREINEYRFQRVLMSVVLNKTMKSMNIEFTVPNTIMGFKIFNLVFLLIALLYYLLISRKLGLSPINEMLGLAALFWCFPVLKLPGFNPVITDVGAFSIGVMIVYHYISNHRIVNIILILLGSFVYPTFILFALLILFPREPYTSSTKATRIERFILPIIYLIVFLIVYIAYPDQFSDTNAQINPINRSFLFFSILLTLFYCYQISAFLPDLNKIKEVFTKIKWFYLIPIIVIILGIKYLIYAYASHTYQPLTTGRYLINIIKQSVANPGVFFISHVIYIGWIPILMIWMGKSIVSEIRANGYGLCMLLAGIGFLSIGSESRQLINFYPLLVVIILMAAQKMKPLKPGLVYGILISSLLLSRFWYSIGSKGDISTNLLQMPAQRYFQFVGPWMSDESYKLNFFIVGIASILFIVLQKTGNLFDLTSDTKAKIKSPVNTKRK